jgi:hypothetical protein
VTVPAGLDGRQDTGRGFDAQWTLVDDPRRLGLGDERGTLGRQSRNP